MVEIQCPHCSDDVELEDGASGLFDCPHCNNEFEFEDDSNTIYISRRPGKVVTTLLALSVLSAIGAGMIYFNESGPSEYESCEDCTWEESLGESLGHGMASGAAEAMAILLMQICLGISIALFVIALVTYFTQQTRRVMRE